MDQSLVWREGFAGIRTLGKAAGLVALLTLCLPLCPGFLSGQSIRGVLLEDVNGAGIPQGAITLSDTAGEVISTTLTNRGGHFSIKAPGHGLFVLSAAAIGYRRGSFGPFQLSDVPDQDVQLHLSPSPIPLPGITAEVERVRTNFTLEAQGFYRRMDRGWGHHFTPKELEELDPMHWQDLLTRVPGVYYAYGRLGGGTIRCQPTGPTPRNPGFAAARIYVDGVRSRLNDVPIRQIAAVEIYRGTAGTPLEFGSSACTVVIWTKG
jgi:hypothetical protein